MFSWFSSVISKIQKLFVYWVAKLSLSVLYTSLALTNTIPADIRQNCNRAKRWQVSGEFQHFFSEADDWQVISGRISVHVKKRSMKNFRFSTDLSSPELTKPLDSLPLAISGAITIEFPLDWVRVANTFRKFFLGLAFLFPITGMEHIWGWFLKECKELPVKVCEGLLLQPWKGQEEWRTAAVSEQRAPLKRGWFVCC